MRSIRWRLGLTFALAALALGVVANAQPEAAGEAVRLLIVDETKTLLSTMRVGGLVGVLKASGLFVVDVRFADAESSWDDPLAGEARGSDLEPYDLLLVIPRGIDDGSDDATKEEAAAAESGSDNSRSSRRCMRADNSAISSE